MTHSLAGEPDLFPAAHRFGAGIEVHVMECPAVFNKEIPGSGDINGRYARAGFLSNTFTLISEHI